MASVRKVPRVRSSVNVAPHRAHFETLPNDCTSDEMHSYIRLQQQIHDALRVQHPDWVEPNGNSPTCDSYESRLTELLGLSPRTNSEVLVPTECVD